MKKHIQPLFILIITLSQNCFAQNIPSIVWEKSLGGTNDDEPFVTHQTSDDGLIVAGESYSNDNDVTGNHGASDYWIVKTDASGSITWQKSFGGSTNDVASAIRETTDGGYIVAGYSKSNDDDVSDHHGTTSYNDYWVLKLDSAGIIEWEKSYGGSLNEFATAVQQTTDGGFVVGGYSYSNDGDVTGHQGSTGTSDYWIVKLDSSGTLLWQKDIGGSFYDFANSLQQTSDGGYIVAGSSISFDGDVTGNHGGTFYGDAWIVKLDSGGDIVWEKCFGGANEDGASSVQQTMDYGYIIAGFSNSNDGDVSGNHGNYDYSVLKIDSSGNLEWQKSLGGSSVDWGTYGIQSSDGGFVIAGYTSSVGGDVTGYHGGDFWGDYWIVRLDESGNLFSQKCLGGSGDDVAASVEETSDGAFIVSGWTQSNDGDVTTNYGVADYWLVELSVPTSSAQIINGATSLSVFPNPAENFFTLQLTSSVSNDATITISNLLGETLFEKTSGSLNGYFRETIPLGEKFSSGIYFVKVNCGQQQWSAPLVVER